MGSQPNLASRPEVVSNYKCPQTLGALPQIWGAKKHQFFDHFSALDTAYLRNETSHRQTKMLVSPKSWPTFRDLWPRNGWHPFAHCDPAFGGHHSCHMFISFSTPNLWGHWTDLNQTWIHIHYDCYIWKICPYSPGTAFLGPTLNFGRTYLCNGNMISTIGKKLSIYRDSSTCPQIWWTLVQKWLRTVGEFLPTP